jgi:exosortase A-associated hydrolase 2
MAPRAEAFFLPAGNGSRFCLYHAPAGACRGALVYLHPFAEEMNKSRRMAALAARALAAAGVAVLQIDLHGCGDSSGEFRDARWDGWLRDVELARAWLRERSGQPVGLWGLRLGALLALDYAHAAGEPVDRLLLWQPVISGSSYLTQFLRLRLAGDLIEGGAEGGGTGALRAALQAGDTLDIAGYELAPQLAAALDALDAQALCVRGCQLDWFEVSAAAERPLSPAAARIAASWREQGVELQTHLAHGEPFWTTQEIAECPSLLVATTALCCARAHV